MAPAAGRGGAHKLSGDTIVALSSGRPPAAIAVVRVSGPAALTAASMLAGTLPTSRDARLRTLRHEGEVLDQALVLVFPGPGSATGEDLVELHCHGGRAVVEAVEAALLTQADVRRAEPGEFTRRALAHGRLDLAEAEGLADLLAAETQAQRRAAWSSAGGALSAAVRGWMDEIAQLSAEIELRIDHDEDDLPPEPDAVGPRLTALAARMRAAVAGPPVERLRDGIRVVIAGRPNAGKSTLLNAMVGRDVAIVTPVAGTTRDRIEAPTSYRGLPYLLTDTAGLTETDDPVEAIGVGRAREAIDAADLVLWVDDMPAPAGAIVVHAKADLPGREEPPAGALAVSGLTGRGIDALWHQIAERTAALVPSGEELAFTRRQRELVSRAAGELVSGMGTPDLLLLAEHCRRARRSMAELLGIDATEVMLDVLFSRFCLGK